MNLMLWQSGTGEAVATPLLSILVLAVLALAVAWSLHWLIGKMSARMLQRLTLNMTEAGTLEAGADDATSLRHLLVEWTARALRTCIWLLFVVFLTRLWPEEEDRLRTFQEQILTRLQNIGAALVENGSAVILIVVGTIFLMRFAAAAIKTAFTLFEQHAVSERAEGIKRRAKTLSLISSGTVQVAILFVGLLVLLQQLGISIAPILASVSIVGIAVGFGAQSLVKDIFAGFLILLEEHYDVGDIVKIGETSGTVEHLTLRVTRIRSLDGSLTTIPNGSIDFVTNRSKDWSRAVMDVEIAYSEDMDRAMQIMLETAQQYRQENTEDITEDPAMLGVDRAVGTGVTLRMVVKTAPARHIDIGRELRRRIKLAFDREGIRVPLEPEQMMKQVFQSETGK